MSDEKNLTHEFLTHLASTRTDLGNGSSISKREIAEAAVDWVLDQKLDTKKIAGLVDSASEFLAKNDIRILSRKQKGKEVGHNRRVQLDAKGGMRDGTIISIEATKNGDQRMWILWDAPVEGSWITLQHLGDLVVAQGMATHDDQIFANEIRDLFLRSGFRNADLYSKLAQEAISKRPTVLLKRALLNLVAKGDARFNADAWVEVWLTDADLEMEKAIQTLRESGLEPLEDKVKKAKEYAKDLAMKMLTDLSHDGIKINWQNLNLDAEMDRIDWEKLVTKESSDAEASLRENSTMSDLNKTANNGLELLQKTTEQDWINRLEARDQQVPFDTKSLKQLWDAFTQSAIRDIYKINLFEMYLDDYNRMKTAFDQFAEKKGLEKWRSGTANDEWLSP